jgi:hypothetical protein
MILLVRGWSVRRTDTCGLLLPQWFATQTGLSRQRVESDNVFFGKYISFDDLVALEVLRETNNARRTSFGRVAPWANGRRNPGAGGTCAHDIRFKPIAKRNPDRSCRRFWAMETPRLGCRKIADG